MKRILRVVLAAAGLCLAAGGARAHGCDPEDKYLIGHYHGDCSHENELPQGYGEAKGADSYVGAWRSGKPHGTGVYRWENGARLEGTFRDGKADGAGFFVSASGKRYEGPFTAGKLVGAKGADCPATPGPLLC